MICCSRLHAVSRFGLYCPNHDWLHRIFFGNSYTKGFALTLPFGAHGLELGDLTLDLWDGLSPRCYCRSFHASFSASCKLDKYESPFCDAWVHGMQCIIIVLCWFDKFHRLKFLWHTSILRTPNVFWREKRVLETPRQWRGQQSGRKPGQGISMAIFFYVENWLIVLTFCSCLLHGKTIALISC